MIPILRVLTRKSKLGFGFLGEISVDKVLSLGKKTVLASAYYKYTSINFIEDVLVEIGITEDLRIEKPGKSRKMHGKYLSSINYKKRSSSASDRLKKSDRISKQGLANKNRGH